MIVLGLSMRDRGAVTIVKDGRLLKIVQSDCFGKSIDCLYEIFDCLNSNENKKKCAPFICYAGKPFREFENKLSILINSFPRGYATIGKDVVKWIRDDLFLSRRLSIVISDITNGQLGRHNLLFCDQIVCKASAALFLNGLDQGFVLCVNGFGEFILLFMSYNVFEFVFQTKNPKILLDKINSLILEHTGTFVLCLADDLSSYDCFMRNLLSNQRLDVKQNYVIDDDVSYSVGAAFSAHYFYFGKVIHQDIEKKSLKDVILVSKNNIAYPIGDIHIKFMCKKVVPVLVTILIAIIALVRKLRKISDLPPDDKVDSVSSINVSALSFHDQI